MKDDKIFGIYKSGMNVAEFVSVYNNSIRHNCTNSKYSDLRDIISDLISRKVSVNVRSFSMDDQQKSTRFVMGLTDVNAVIEAVNRNQQDGLISIINENIDINDGGVSGVILGNAIEFSPNDTPRCVEKDGVCSLPLDVGVAVLNSVYGINLIDELGADNIKSKRVEFSIHLEPQGKLMKRYTVWEVSEATSSVSPVLRYPNNFSAIIGDKAFGLLVADSALKDCGFLVPRSLVLSRVVPPFSFGVAGHYGEPKWTRTAPVSKVSGKFHTSKRWEDPFILMNREEMRGDEAVNIASLIIQDGIKAVYSGAGVINKDECFVEVVEGYGDSFMVGEMSAKPNSQISNLVKNKLHSKLFDTFGCCSFEWVYDGALVWLMQVNQIDDNFDENNIVTGECDRYIDFYTDNGLESLRELVKSIKGSNVGVNLIGNVGITSHFGDILRVNKVVSKITRVSADA